MGVLDQQSMDSISADTMLNELGGQSMISLVGLGFRVQGLVSEARTLNPISAFRPPSQSP